MAVNEDRITRMVSRILEEYAGGPNGISIPAEVSGRHVHLSSEHIEALFGKGHKLTKNKELSLPGQFLSNERVTVFTPKGELKNVAVLGPARDETQVELSRTDSRRLGLNPPVNNSGDLKGASDAYIMSEYGVVKAEGSVIVAANHIHMTEEDAKRFNLRDNQKVRVRMETERPVTFEDVNIRVSDAFSLVMHIDTDEANACDYKNGAIAKITGLKAIKTPAVRAQKKGKTGIGLSEEKLITAERARELVKTSDSKVVIRKGSILTPLAKDVFHDARIVIEFNQEDIQC